MLSGIGAFYVLLPDKSNTDHRAASAKNDITALTIGENNGIIYQSIVNIYT